MTSLISCVKWVEPQLGWGLSERNWQQATEGKEINWVPDLIPAAVSCRFRSGVVSEGAISKQGEGTRAYNDGRTPHEQFLKCHRHSSPPTLIHHPTQQPGEVREVETVCMSGLRRRGVWLINQTTSTQPHNTLTRQGIYIALHTCQEIGQPWIITPPKGAAGGASGLLSFFITNAVFTQIE